MFNVYLDLTCLTFYEASLPMTTGSTLKIKGPEDLKVEIEGSEDDVAISHIAILYQDLFWD